MPSDLVDAIRTHVSLTLGTGPLSPTRAGRAVPPLPDGDIVYVEPHPRRIQAVVGDRVVLETEAALLVHRPGRTLTYAFPPAVVGDLPHEASTDAPGYVEVPWDAVDGWIEEGRRLVHYPPNPYHRVDCRPTRRHLRVKVAGTVLVDTDDTVVLFETALEPKLYVAPAHVRTDLLHRTATTTWCNYKGEATWWAFGAVDDVAWSYEAPLPESTPITGFLSFEPSRCEIEAELPGK